MRGGRWRSWGIASRGPIRSIRASRSLGTSSGSPKYTLSPPRGAAAGARAQEEAKKPSQLDVIKRLAGDWPTKLKHGDVEHDMTVVMGLAHRITVLHYGAILAEGTPAEIQNNPRVLEVYLKT